MKRKTAAICCGALVAAAAVLAAVFVALYLTVFRPRTPRVVAAVVRTDVAYFRLLPTPALNLSLAVEVSVENPNYASFRYGEVGTTVRYHGAAVGLSVVPPGSIGARATTTVLATVVVDAGKVVTSPYFPPEGFAGVLPFSTATAVAGKAVVLGRFKIRASSVVTCNVTAYPISRQESPPQCTSTVHVG